jgi:2-polyprenyl-6-methoxyphenol hydroxylase-like FAD-dependent oxidoreductase
MRIIVVGAGPTGLFTAIALTRRGHEVVLVDRDPGPPTHGPWHRRGVMQFHHAHTFRGPVVDALRAEMPDVLQDLETAGASVADGPDGRPAALLCRRATFDAVLCRRAVGEPGLRLLTGRVDGVVRDRGRIRGVTMDGRSLTADVVIDASGRASRFTSGLRAPAEGGDCGAVYVDRQYRFHEGFDGGPPPVPTNSAIGLSLSLSGYVAIAFLHDDRTFSITFVHDGSDHRLRALRFGTVFEAAVGAIPGLSEWAGPCLSRPIARVLPGGALHNGYRGQSDAAGRPCTPGLISVGDAVCTTTPLAGRGVTLALAQARALVDSLDDDDDVDSASARFDQWCTANVEPWFEDHRHADADRMRRWSGGDVDVTRRLPSDLIVAAAATAADLRAAAEPYARMDALPASLDPVEPRAREIYAAGWRPTVPDGPTRAELAELCVAHGEGVA